MECNKCHSEIELEDRFCGFCGFLKTVSKKNQLHKIGQSDIDLQEEKIRVTKKYQAGQKLANIGKDDSSHGSWMEDVSRIPVIGSTLRGVGVFSTVSIIIIFIALFFLRIGESASIGGLIFVIIIIIGFFGYVWFSATSPQRAARKEKDHIKRLEKEQADHEERDLKKRQMEMERELLKNEEMGRYKKLRKEIESMPMYQAWRKQVFEKFGKQCQGCPRGEGLEIHHRESLYSILKKCKIKDKYGSLECKGVWDIDNGLVLCHECHERMESSVAHNKLSWR